jgi:hypothetical protein
MWADSSLLKGVYYLLMVCGTNNVRDIIYKLIDVLLFIQTTDLQFPFPANSPCIIVYKKNEPSSSLTGTNTVEISTKILVPLSSNSNCGIF